ncbi:hypothetical protein [Paenibacillus sanguinis]|uniref:hypothetical protein n=1 Tax=Paenibacillus sanguinis TaxID=225906 RepID=UPI00035F2DBA|nr:hypothetical protein [Paenibacillus sanguinis]
MLTFFRLNGLSALYALILFVQTELMVNVYRIERITGIINVNIYINLLIVIIFIAASFLCYFLTKRQFGKSKIKYFTTVLWIPYFLIFLLSFASLYPITNPQEKPLGGVGLVILITSIVFPIYIAIINFATSLRSNDGNINSGVIK